MEKDCLKLAEWVGTNCFDGRSQGLMYYSTPDFFDPKIKTGHWRLIGKLGNITTFELYKLWLEELGGISTKNEFFSFYEHKFEPTNFIDFIGQKGFWYYRWSFKGEKQPPCWLKGNNTKIKYNTEDLWELFNENKK